jgi:tetratricopeptide (TPR) repeat protein
MENYLEYIDAYFNNAMSKEEAILFEKKVEDDKEFANEVAFYLSAKQSLVEQVHLEKKEHFRQLLAQANASDVHEKSPQHYGLLDRFRGLFAPPAVANVSGSYVSMKRTMVYRLAIAAAILICVFFAGYLFLSKSASPQQLADSYMNENLQTLGVKMSAESDSIDIGKRMFNEAHYDSAIAQFQSIIKRDTGNFEANRYLGVVYLRKGDYNEALSYFQQLEHQTVAVNPAIFYQALTLMKRNQPGDKQKARELLKEVRDQGLEGEKFARQWLNKRW